MNLEILKAEVQAFINANIDNDIGKIALAKSAFKNINSAELAGQINSKKKSKNKLPTWFNQKNIYYPVSLSIEQTSSEITAKYKSNLVKGSSLIDLTAGFGVDSYYFAKKITKVTSCEIDETLSQIIKHNFISLKVDNVEVLNIDGIDFVSNDNFIYDTIYLDPARRKGSSKVFKLADCTPNVVENLDSLLAKSQRVIIKTSPLLDIKAGLKELKNVKEIHIVSVKNECKELLWVLDSSFNQVTTLHCVSLNETEKNIQFQLNDNENVNYLNKIDKGNYLYEPDVALMKSGAFNQIAKSFNLFKLDVFSHLYSSEELKSDFLGRIFIIEEIINFQELKNRKNIAANVICRNFKDKAETLVKKFKIKPSKDKFLIFTQIHHTNKVIAARIIQHY